MAARRAGLVIMALAASVPRFAVAQAPGETPPAASSADDFEACKQRRSEIYAQATAQADLGERTRLLQSMPECKPPPASEPAPVPPPAVATAPPSIAAATPPAQAPQIHAAETATVSLTIAPITTVLFMAFGGIALDARAEVAVGEHLGAGVNAAYASAPALLTEDVMVSVYHVAPQIAWYMRRFSGLHAGMSLHFASGHNTAGTGWFGGEVTEGDARFFGGSAFIGWKLIRRSGLTGSVQLGVAVTRSYIDGQAAETDISQVGGLYVGWSFGSSSRARARIEAERRTQQQHEAEERARVQRREQAWAFTREAAEAARLDDCARVAMLDVQVRELDVEFHASVFARDVAIARCVAPSVPARS